MKTRKIIIKTLVIAMVLGILLSSPAYAFSTSTANNFLSKGTSNTPITISEAAGVFMPLGQILFTIAVGVLVIVGVIMGVKYMMASANDKANIKEKLIWYIISIIVVTGGIGITALIMNFFGEL